MGWWQTNFLSFLWIRSCLVDLLRQLFFDWCIINFNSRYIKIKKHIYLFIKWHITSEPKSWIRLECYQRAGSTCEISILQVYWPSWGQFLKISSPYGRHSFPIILAFDIFLFVCFRHLSAWQLTDIKRRNHLLVTSERDGFGIIRWTCHNI